MSSLSEKIAASNDIDKRLVEVPQWDVTVEVRSMSARSRAHMVQSNMDGGGVSFERLYPDVVILCTYDPDTGERAFEESDREMLLDRNAAAVELIAAAAMELSGLGAKAVDEAGKDSSSTTPSDASTSP